MSRAYILYRYPRSFVSLFHTMLSIVAVMLLLSTDGELKGADSPEFLKPGSIYRTYSTHLRSKNDWRVTDPKVRNEGGLEFLPNPKLSLNGVELEDVTHADLLIAHWLGHSGSLGQVFTFNDSPEMNIPLNPNLPSPKREKYLNMDNPVFPLDPKYIKRDNIFSGSFEAAFQGKRSWGQWGWYHLYLHTYLAPSHPHPSVRIVNLKPGDSFSDHPAIQIEAQSPAGIKRVEVFAKYTGYDENGNNQFNDWHGYFYNEEPQEHVGSIAGDAKKDGLYEIRWDTAWVPDQRAGEVSLIARALDNKGIWSVSEAVADLTLKRSAYSIKMYTVDPDQIPTSLVRDGRSATMEITIPDDLTNASDARIAMRTWNGFNNEQKHTPLSLNGGEPLKVIDGADHDYAFELEPLPHGSLRKGINTLELSSTTIHHGCEVLIPGPAILVRRELANSKKPTD